MKSLRRCPAANARSWRVSIYSAVLCERVVRDVDEFEFELVFGFVFVVMRRCLGWRIRHWRHIGRRGFRGGMGQWPFVREEEGENLMIFTRENRRNAKAGNPNERRDGPSFLHGPRRHRISIE